MSFMFSSPRFRRGSIPSHNHSIVHAQQKRKGYFDPSQQPPRLPVTRPHANLPPMGNPCTICNSPHRADLEAGLASGASGKSLGTLYALSLPALYRHIRSGHQARQQAAHSAPPSTIAQPAAQTITPPHNEATETLRKATRLARSAEKHMRAAMKSSDLKAANGAIQSATKAYELFGKASGQLQSGANVNVNIGVEARVAMDLRSAAEQLSPHDVTEHAKSWLGAQIEAGDHDAIAAVVWLMRTLPSADATVPDGTGD